MSKLVVLMIFCYPNFQSPQNKFFIDIKIKYKNVNLILCYYFLLCFCLVRKEHTPSKSVKKNKKLRKRRVAEIEIVVRRKVNLRS